MSDLQRTVIDGKDCTIGQLTPNMVKIVFDDGQVIYAYPGAQKFNQHHDDQGRFASADGSMLNSKQVTAVKFYTASGKGFDTINKMLRNGYSREIDPEGLGKARLQQYADNMAAAVATRNTTTDMTLYRGISDDFASQLESQVGTTFTDHGFVSTSESPDIATMFGYLPNSTFVLDQATGNIGVSGGNVIEISVPKGTPALDAARLRLTSSQADESEVILQRGTTFALDRVTGSNATGRHFYVHVIPGQTVGKVVATPASAAGSRFVWQVNDLQFGKFNQHHDEQGRFAEADGSGSQHKMTPTDYAVVQEYSQWFHHDVNEYLRHKKDFGNAVNIKGKQWGPQKAINQLDKMMADSTIDQQTLYRSVEKDELARITQAGVGGSFVDKGFVSTTSDPEVLKMFRSDGFVTISAPAGTHALALGEGMSLHPDEKETVLDRGYRFVVDSIGSGSGGKPMVGVHLASTRPTAKAGLVPKDNVGRGSPAALDRYSWHPGDLEIEIGKSNPNHDDRGRFAESAGTATAGHINEMALQALRDRGGFTFDPQTGSTPDKGYSVGGYGSNGIYDASTYSKADLQAFMQENAHALTNNYLGGWVDNGKVYLDVTKVFPPNEREAAIQAGRERNQIAIADLGELHAGRMDNAFINTGGTGKVSRVGKPTMFMFDPRQQSIDDIHAGIVAMIKGDQND